MVLVAALKSPEALGRLASAEGAVSAMWDRHYVEIRSCVAKRRLFDTFYAAFHISLSHKQIACSGLLRRGYFGGPPRLRAGDLSGVPSSRLRGNPTTGTVLGEGNDE